MKLQKHHFLIGVFCLIPSVASAECQHTRPHFDVGLTVTSDWVVSSGGTCTVDFHISGASEILGVAVKVRPKHGIAGSASRYAIGYQAAKGYTGADSFVFNLILKTNGQFGVATYNVNITVK